MKVIPDDTDTMIRPFGAHAFPGNPGAASLSAAGSPLDCYPVGVGAPWTNSFAVTLNNS
jgi:hypothetical protein